MLSSFYCVVIVGRGLGFLVVWVEHVVNMMRSVMDGNERWCGILCCGVVGWLVG